MSRIQRRTSDGIANKNLVEVAIGIHADIVEEFLTEFIEAILGVVTLTKCSIRDSCDRLGFLVLRVCSAQVGM